MSNMPLNMLRASANPTPKEEIEDQIEHEPEDPKDTLFKRLKADIRDLNKR